MTIDEAIKHAREVAKDNREKAKEFCKPCDYMYGVCEKCAEEHEQLAEWLEELKELWKNQGQVGDFWYSKGYTKAVDDFADRLSKYLDVENATKYGNQNAEQQINSYSTLMKYEIAWAIDDVAEQLKAGVVDG